KCLAKALATVLLPQEEKPSTAITKFLSAISLFTSSNYYSCFVHQRNFNQIFINNTFRKEDIFFIIDRTIDIIAQPIFVGQSEYLCIDCFHLYRFLACNITYKMSKRSRFYFPTVFQSITFRRH